MTWHVVLPATALKTSQQVLPRSITEHAIPQGKGPRTRPCLSGHQSQAAHGPSRRRHYDTHAGMPLSLHALWCWSRADFGVGGQPAPTGRHRGCVQARSGGSGWDCLAGAPAPPAEGPKDRRRVAGRATLRRQRGPGLVSRGLCTGPVSEGLPQDGVLGRWNRGHPTCPLRERAQPDKPAGSDSRIPAAGKLAN